MSISNDEISGNEFLLKNEQFLPDELFTMKKELPQIGSIKKVSIRKDDCDGKFK